MGAISGGIGIGLGIANMGANFYNQWQNRENQMRMLQKTLENKLQLQQIDQNFQEHMSSTNFQRMVKDLKLAHLNPSLALTNGASAMLKSSSDWQHRKTIYETLMTHIKYSKNFKMSPIRPR